MVGVSPVSRSWKGGVIWVEFAARARHDLM